MNPQPQPPRGPVGELDAAGRSLSDALRISFVILKVIMIVLVVLFLLSGFRTVGPDEKALVLRFGKIQGVGEERLLGPGLKWLLPYPIDEIVRIPVEKMINLPIDSFWYYQSEWEMLPQGPKDRIRPPKALAPLLDGYCITRDERAVQNVLRSEGSDYNIVHCKWQLIYQIYDPERFFKNVYVDMENLQAGQNYADAITGSATPLLKSLVEDSVVTAMVHYTIDEAISSRDTIPGHVKRLLQEKLNEIESGIRVISIQLTDSIWPRQVNDAFKASISASQERSQAISEAKAYAEKTLNETAGPIASQLLAVLQGQTVTEEEKELLWDQLAGTAQEKIFQATADRMKVVRAAQANAVYLQQILPEYRKHPNLVIQRIYLDAIEDILNNVDEKFIIQPAEGAKGTEIRIRLNKNQMIGPGSEKQ